MRKFAWLALSFNLVFLADAFGQGSLSTSIQKQTEKPNYKGSFTATLENAQLTDETTRTNLTRAAIGADIQYQATEVLLIDLLPRFFYDAGFAQTDDENAEAGKSSLTVKNASAVFTPLVFAQLEAGAVDQSRVHNGLLLDDSPFPAAVLRLRTAEAKSAGFSASLIAEYAIPTSSSLSSNTSELEKTPTFQSTGVGLEFSNSKLRSEMSLHHFQFSALPTSIANKSGLLGNTVEALAGTNRTFAYRFSGLSAQAKGKAIVNRRLMLGLDADYVQNQAAPTSLGNAYRISGKAMIRLTSTSTLIPEYEYFRLEPDAFVAAYADFKYQPNRVGYRTGVGYQYRKSVKVSALFGERVPLFESTTQSREKTFDLSLETSHALF